MEAKVEDRKGPQEMEELLAVGQISSCPPATSDTPRHLRLHKASRHSAEPQQMGPCRSNCQSAEGHVRMYWRPSVLEGGIEDQRW